jgi:hypothetical protein
LDNKPIKEAGEQCNSHIFLYKKKEGKQFFRIAAFGILICALSWLSALFMGM